MMLNIIKSICFLIILNSFSIAQNYEIKHDTLTASGWFGGDDRVGQQRNVAVAQSIYIEESINLESFSFYFTSTFDSVNGLLTGHEVTLKLHIRDSIGTILHSVFVIVPDTFQNGWVTWPGINYNISSPGLYIFSTYLVGGYDSNQVHSGQGCDLSASYLNGERYVKYVTNDSDAVAWGDWSLHSWDSDFWLIGISIPTGIEYEKRNISDFILEQNYPNPFNPGTTIRFKISESGFTNLKIYDVLGNKVATLVDEYKPAGRFEVKFNADKLPSGVYFYQLQSGNFVETKKLILMK